MELKKIKVKNFKKVSQVELDLASLNILVGANASGKSSILQAIHLASCLMRQVEKINYPSVISVNELDYLPTEDYPTLGNNQDWGNTDTMPGSRVDFKFEVSTSTIDEGEATITKTSSSSYAEFRSARNAGITVKTSIPENTWNTRKGHDLFRNKEKFFSAYSPGVSGISNEEQKQSKRVVLKACSYGDANGYLRNALFLLGNEKIDTLQDWLAEIIEPVTISIKHDDAKDLVITAMAGIRGRGRERPLELLGMGYIQLIQIFCYLLLFNPEVMLIDEPDIHLHPNVQEKLPRVLSKIAKERNIKIILSTHSPFIIRGAPTDARVFWMEDGAVKNNNREAIELALGWGAFGKKIILVSEDTNTKLLQKILSQWPDIEKYVAIHPGNGYSNLPKPEQAKKMKELLGDYFDIVVHRDRDSLSDAEVASLQKQYTDKDTILWVTDQSDIESYFTEPSFLATLLGDAEVEYESMLSDIITHFNTVDNSKFVSHRKSHNQELWSGGGGPTNQDVWDEQQRHLLKAANGKMVFKRLTDITPVTGSKNKFTEQAIFDCELGGKIAPSLKACLEGLLNKG